MGGGLHCLVFSWWEEWAGLNLLQQELMHIACTYIDAGTCDSFDLDREEITAALFD